jgi:membrane-associated phospholipid phosphatase
MEQERSKRAKETEPATKPTPPPPQELGDTPVAPWEMPTPDEKAAAAPVRRALRDALVEVDSPEKAEALLAELEARAGDQTEGEVAETAPTPTTPAQAAEQVEAAAETAPPGETAPEVLTETARILAASHGREREVVSQAAQEVFNPEQQGAPAAAGERQREYLRRAVLKRLKPLDALDTWVFLQINHLPHTRLLNAIFYGITFIFTGGAAWFALMGMIFARNRPLGWRVIRDSAVPLALATAIVEYPVKSYFRRRRPFITIIQAIVVGTKPGTWSFPSGHSATAFAGALLLGNFFPRWRRRLYTVAGLVAFSRVYLGDHYPGDVVAGSAIGAALAWFLRRLPWPWRPR